MRHTIRVASATLNQWALDFDGNYQRILQSIIQARDMGAQLRTGPELEICGYSCEDHFYESDTFYHSWQVLVELLKSEHSRDILIDVGMPVMHKNVAYNCRVIIFNMKILLIRPKLQVCDDGNYRESRWFTSWKKLRQVEEYHLPRMVSSITGQQVVPFGDAVLSTQDTCIGFEICEELWNPASTHITMCLDGVEVICNGSGSYMELRKAHVTVDLIRNATYKAGGCYIFSNLRGCDGQRLYFNGASCIAQNGDLLVRAKQFSLQDVEVIAATVDLEDIRSYRNCIRSRSHLSSSSPQYPRIHLDFHLSPSNCSVAPTPPMDISFKPDDPMEEIARGPACWLWDYLRRSNQKGFFLPLSGGVDSTSTALIVYYMCQIVYETIQSGGDNKTLQYLRNCVDNTNFQPKNPEDICNQLFTTCYMSTVNSSEATKGRATHLASLIGSHHMTVDIDRIVSTVINVFQTVTGYLPKFTVFGGSALENLALQNVQARIRMVVGYLFAQLSLWTRHRQGQLLVLGSANVDESLRGYMTKYDCSSADINPIGGISKTDLKHFLHYTRTKLPQFQMVLDAILEAPPTAELVPLGTDGEVSQTDEDEMGISYAELSDCGRLRKIQQCGPYSMFCKLSDLWSDRMGQPEIAEKVKHFFRCYAQNRHKMTVLTPALHAEHYSPDDNRFDHRPFLYRTDWYWQFRAINDLLAQNTA